jgi:hypothetical protein
MPLSGIRMASREDIPRGLGCRDLDYWGRLEPKSFGF